MGLANLLGRAALGPFARALPPMGETERAALESGTVGFEGELFAGCPDFDALRARGPNRLSEAEQAFLAHAAVVTRIDSVNVAAAVTVMVPNSLGPAELLLHYGTDAQKQHDLPRLADGRELPCFGLTSPYAGSDAASIPDIGELTERVIDGRRVRGFNVNFDKRYITLAPVVTVVGLAFQAVDQSRPPGEQELGITCALIPVPTAGMQIGRRHLPMNSAFMNRPIRGADVFVPMDWIIGGEPQGGRGWRMLMESLAAGRAISLPGLGAALQQTTLFVVNGYGRIREQFGLPIGRFHAVAAVIARVALDLYASDAARRYTAAALDKGERTSVASAILKVQLTEAGRRAVNDGMDILGGKAIILGPGNLLGVGYRHAPIAITVEGANLLTRSLIIFGQGAVRCHPHVLSEMKAVADQDASALGRALLAHGGHVLRNFVRSVAGARLKGTPPPALRAEAEEIARLGDVLSCLYLASACLWRYEFEAEPKMLRELQANLPSRVLVFVLPLLLLGGTRRLTPPADRAVLALAYLQAADRVIQVDDFAP